MCRAMCKIQGSVCTPGWIFLCCATSSCGDSCHYPETERQGGILRRHHHHCVTKCKHDFEHSNGFFLFLFSFSMNKRRRFRSQQRVCMYACIDLHSLCRMMKKSIFKPREGRHANQPYNNAETIRAIQCLKQMPVNERM